MILRRYFFSVALIVTLHLVSTSPVSAETTADAKNNSANFWGTFQANPPGFKAYDWDTYSNSKDNGLWSSAFTFTNGVETTRLREDGGDNTASLYHDAGRILFHKPKGGIAEASHHVRCFNEALVSGTLRSKAESYGGEIQAIGTLEMVFIKEKAVTEDKTDNAFASIQFEYATKEGTAGVDYKLEMFRRKYGFFYGQLEPLEVKRKLTNGEDVVADEPIKPSQGTLQSFTTDLTQLETGDLLFINLTTRAWANGTNKTPPEFPTPAVPEPATWLLGLTGLAGVVATQAWTSRRHALRS
jgi:hypothetical protein